MDWVTGMNWEGHSDLLGGALVGQSLFNHWSDMAVQEPLELLCLIDWSMLAVLKKLLNQCWLIFTI
jgi:hypothetical protein